MDGFVRRVPMRGGRIRLFLCRSCERFTAWMKSDSESIQNQDDLAAIVISPTQPDKCRFCGEGAGNGEDGKPIFSRWADLNPSCNRPVAEGEDSLFSAECWHCGKKTEFELHLGKNGFFSFERRSGFYMWGTVVLCILLSPLIIVISPFLIVAWIIWKKSRGECLRCSTPFTSYESLPKLECHSAEEIHRCPSCGACYIIPMSGPVAARPLSPAEMKDLGL